jgi:hypothetical protein
MDLQNTYIKPLFPSILKTSSIEKALKENSKPFHYFQIPCSFFTDGMFSALNNTDKMVYLTLVSLCLTSNNIHTGIVQLLHKNSTTLGQQRYSFSVKRLENQGLVSLYINNNINNNSSSSSNKKNSKNELTLEDKKLENFMYKHNCHSLFRHKALIWSEFGSFENFEGFCKSILESKANKENLDPSDDLARIQFIAKSGRYLTAAVLKHLKIMN